MGFEIRKFLNIGWYKRYYYNVNFKRNFFVWIWLLPLFISVNYSTMSKLVYCELMIKISVSIIISEWKYFAPIGMLYNILLLINCYTGNITTKCHSESMSVNRDLTETFHQKVSSLPVSIESDSRYFQSSWICFSFTKYSSLQRPVKAVYIEKL